jgi:hypothetical protein
VGKHGIKRLAFLVQCYFQPIGLEFGHEVGGGDGCVGMTKQVEQGMEGVEENLLLNREAAVTGLLSGDDWTNENFPVVKSDDISGRWIGHEVTMHAGDRSWGNQGKFQRGRESFQSPEGQKLQSGFKLPLKTGQG